MSSRERTLSPDRIDELVDDLEGRVILFPIKPRSCFTCEHAGFTEDGVTICGEFNEGVDNEVVWASDCPEYTYQPADQCRIIERDDQ